ncbi:astacin-like metalloprotease toxin 3 isoform X3 [Hydra vulgaris]|uniref:Metalloendopeptidase n=1 Tax=Hydra vulgaris TaxID=6087 RepID=A0ABM4B5R6_HYDVU
MIDTRRKRLFCLTFLACLFHVEHYESKKIQITTQVSLLKDSILRNESSDWFGAREWPDGIVPYKFDTNNTLLEIEKMNVKEAMAHIQNKTCIKFVPRTNENVFLTIERVNVYPCFTPIGYVQAKSARMIFGNSCTQKLVMIHELLHVLGFEHEHQRVDRDIYITVNMSNVQKGFEHEFIRHQINWTTYYTPYDINSVMHFGNFDYSKYLNQSIHKNYHSQTQEIDFNKKYMTIYNNHDYKTFLGSKSGLSPGDVDKINLRYNCSIKVLQSSATTVQPWVITVQPIINTVYKTLLLLATKSNVVTFNVENSTPKKSVTLNKNYNQIENTLTNFNHTEPDLTIFTVFLIALSLAVFFCCLFIKHYAVL